jgi:hypothetical protein
MADVSLFVRHFVWVRTSFSIDNSWSPSCPRIMIIANVMILNLIFQFATLQIDNFLIEQWNRESSVICIEKGRRFHRLASFRATPIPVFFRANRSFSDWPPVWIHDYSQINGNSVRKFFVSRLADECGWLRCSQEISKMLVWRKITSGLDIET